jgi:hypothetical protein
MKIRSVGAELFHADGQTGRQTDITKLKVAFRNFAKAPKNRANLFIWHLDGAVTKQIVYDCKYEDGKLTKTGKPKIKIRSERVCNSIVSVHVIWVVR